MLVQLKRILKGEDATIGELYVNDKYITDTLEDPVRPLPETCPYTSKGKSCQCVEKQYGNTAIPAGTYKLTLSYSPRFKKILPEILEVPHFLGIRIHSLNTSSQTEGCVGVGKWDGKNPNWISNSRVEFNKLFKILEKAYKVREEIYIEIENL